MNLDRYKRELGIVNQNFNDAREQVAAHIRDEVVLPACKEHKVLFLSTKQGFGFRLTRDEARSRGLTFPGGDLITNQHDCQQLARPELWPVLQLLNLFVGDRYRIGLYVDPVTEDDLAETP